jgi:hypothetical protein
MNCPKCDTDISDSYQPDDPSVGICGGWYCDACDLGISEGECEPLEDDVFPVSEKFSHLGTPLSELSGQPGDARDPNDPRHAGYENFKRIARSWGYD